MGWYAVRLRSRGADVVRIAYAFPVRRRYVVELRDPEPEHLALSHPRLREAQFRGPFVHEREAEREAARWRAARPP